MQPPTDFPLMAASPHMLHVQRHGRAAVKLTKVGKHNLKWLPFVVLVRLPLMLPFVAAQFLVDLGESLQGMPGLKMGAWFERNGNGKRKEPV